MEPWFDRSFGEWYPKLYPHRNLAEAERALDTVYDWLPETGILLDLGCGSGRHLRILHQHGRHAVGLDRSRSLLTEAHRFTELRGRLMRGDMRAIPLASQSVSATLSMFTSFGYFGSRDVHTALLTEVSRVTRKKGRFVLDYLNAPQVRRTLVPSSRRTIDDYRIEERRSIQSGGDGDAVVKETDVLDSTGNVVQRFREEVSLYERDDLVQMLRESGWAEIVVLGDYGGAPWSPESNRLLVISENAS